MIGRFSREIISAAHLIKGMSSSDDIADGGFAPTTKALNLINSPGVLYWADAVTDIDTDDRLASNGEVIATSPDHSVFLGDNRLLVAANASGDGTFYRYNGTKIIAAAYATDSTNNYGKGFTDIINFAGETYVTSKELVKRWTSTGTIADLTGGAFTNTTYPHPALVFENNAFYGDKNLLLRQTAANGALATILTLSADQVIVALGIDPGSGLMLISVTSSLNMGNTLPAIHRVMWYDGFSNKPRKSVIVEDMVTAFYHVNGTVYVGYGHRLGRLSGAGIHFLRNLTNVTFDVDDLPWKHNFAHVGNMLMVVNGASVLAYGEAITGIKTFHHIYDNQIATVTNKFRCIFNAGSDRLGVSSATENLHRLPLTTVAGVYDPTIDTNWERFHRPIYPRSVLVELDGAINTANISLVYGAETDSAINSNSLSVRYTSTSIRLVEFVGFLSERVTALRFRLGEASGSNVGVRRMTLFYDVI